MNNLPPRIDPEFMGLIPPLSQEEYDQLEQNILAHKKCRDAIIVWGDILVDGHNRMRICAAHNITFEIKEMEFESRDAAKLWILDNQLGRRNLTDAMRIELALSKVELLRQQARENQVRGGREKSGKSGAEKLLSPVPEQNVPPIDVRNAVASEANVSDGTVHHYMQISKHGSPELLEQVKTGELKIKTAYRLLHKEVIKQLKQAGQLYDYIEECYPIKGNEEANQRIKSRLVDLQRHLATLRGANHA